MHAAFRFCDSGWLQAASRAEMERRRNNLYYLEKKKK